MPRTRQSCTSHAISACLDSSVTVAITITLVAPHQRDMAALLGAMVCLAGLTDAMRVAVIGGGVAGLAAARSLQECVVYDTGKRSVGGRCSSRLPGETGWAGAVDHAAQFVECSSDAFAKAYVEDAVERGILREFQTAKRRLFVGTPELGISAVPRDLAQSVEVWGDVWVPPKHGLRQRRNGGWLVEGESFDAVIIAHNGKCAERISSRFESRKVAEILRARFGVLPAKRIMTLNSVYSLLLELREPLCSASVLWFADDPVVRYLSNNGAKLGWTSPDGSVVLTALSTAAFGSANKHPQEALVDTAVEARVVSDMIAALNLRFKAKLQPRRTRLQLWGAALPLNAWISDAGFVWDAEHRVGIVGDWLRAEGEQQPTSSVESAFLSGHALALHLTSDPLVSRGLQGRFVAGTQQPDFAPARSSLPDTAPKTNKKATNRTRRRYSTK